MLAGVPVWADPVDRAGSSQKELEQGLVGTPCLMVPGPPSTRAMGLLTQRGQKKREPLAGDQQPPGDGVGGMMLVLG